MHDSATRDRGNKAHSEHIIQDDFGHNGTHDLHHHDSDKWLDLGTAFLIKRQTVVKLSCEVPVWGT